MGTTRIKLSAGEKTGAVPTLELHQAETQRQDSNLLLRFLKRRSTAEESVPCATGRRVASALICARASSLSSSSSSSTTTGTGANPLPRKPCVGFLWHSRDSRWPASPSAPTRIELLSLVLRALVHRERNNTSRARVGADHHQIRFAVTGRKLAAACNFCTDVQFPPGFRSSRSICP